MQTKNFCYGAYRATEMAEAIEDAIWKGHRYRNVLCDLELQRRKVGVTMLAQRLGSCD